jgi:phosphatidylinositol-binding clathrin assembly protein
MYVVEEPYHKLQTNGTLQVLDEPENEITITVFRLLVLDLLALFQVLNQAMINILGHFFEMSKPDAERAMEIYHKFTRQTDFVVQYLSTAREYEHHTRVEVPKLKHAPVNLGRQLEDYLKDPDFEIHRRQYLAEVDAKKGGGASSSKATSAAASSMAIPEPKTNGSSSAAPKAPLLTKGPDPDLIDFFDSIEQNQTPMAMGQQQQQQQQPAPTNTANQWQANSPFNVPQQTGQLQANGFVSQQTGFPDNTQFQQQQNTSAYNTQQLQPSFAGGGYGGLAPQQTFSPSGLSSIPQDLAVSSFQSNAMQQQPMQTGLQPGQQNTNPFRQSTLIGQPSGMSSFSNQPTGSTLQRSNTNPFARPQTSSAAVTGVPSFSNPPSTSPFQAATPAFASQPPAPIPMQAMATGTNPFVRNFGTAPQQVQPPQPGGGLMPQPTGTNPFRQGAFVNHQTGMGWQHGQQPIGGGLDQLETQPVFPRPQQGTAWQS